MPLTCGWPIGSQEADGHCGETPTVAFLVEVRDLPLDYPDGPAHHAALLLCGAHAPVVEPSTSDDEPYRANFSHAQVRIIQPDGTEIPISNIITACTIRIVDNRMNAAVITFEGVELEVIGQATNPVYVRA